MYLDGQMRGAPLLFYYEFLRSTKSGGVQPHPAEFLQSFFVI